MVGRRRVADAHRLPHHGRDGDLVLHPEVLTGRGVDELVIHAPAATVA